MSEQKQELIETIEAEIKWIEEYRMARTLEAHLSVDIVGLTKSIGDLLHLQNQILQQP